MPRRTTKEELSKMRWWMIPLLPLLAVMSIPCNVISGFSKSRWFCDFWGFHLKPDDTEHVENKHVGKCPRCGSNVRMSVHGGWL